jgi:hypothetical protein
MTGSPAQNLGKIRSITEQNQANSGSIPEQNLGCEGNLARIDAALAEHAMKLAGKHRLTAYVAAYVAAARSARIRSACPAR